MLQVGKPGEAGIAEISDMLFTVADALLGAGIVEVNMAGPAAGDVSFHNGHWHAGGAADSTTEYDCQIDSSPCESAFVMPHLAWHSVVLILKPGHA